jgi:hypothetical protein
MVGQGNVLFIQSGLQARRKGYEEEKVKYVFQGILFCKDRRDKPSGPPGQRTFNTCSLAFSSSSFIRTTNFWMAAS